MTTFKDQGGKELNGRNKKSEKIVSAQTFTPCRPEDALEKSGEAALAPRKCAGCGLMYCEEGQCPQCAKSDPMIKNER